VTAAPELANVSFKAEKNFVNSITAGLKRADPFTVARMIYNKQLFTDVAPMPCGKVDSIPSSAWISETIGILRRSDILQLRDTTALSVTADNIDSVLVPKMFGDTTESYTQWPEVDAKPAGTYRIVNVPPWLSPYLDSVEVEPSSPTNRKTSKATKDTKDNIDAKNEEYSKVATQLAKAFFVELKNGGVALEASVPWYRLEFLDALGYLMEIEQPVYDRASQRENLYGYLNGAALKIQSTPGGSKATMQLSFTHVRTASTHEEFALPSHPLFSITGGPASSIRSFLSSTGRMYDRSTQKTLEGGGHESYLDDAIAAVRNG